MNFIHVFMNFMIKIIVITICLMYEIFMIAELTGNMITTAQEFNFFIVAEIIFNALIAYILTSNAPKIAQTIITGQPQLSMGEFVQAAAAVATTGVAAKNAAGMAGKAGLKAGVTAMNATAGVGAGISAANTARKMGGGASGMAKAFGDAAILDPTKQTLRNARDKVANWAKSPLAKGGLAATLLGKGGGGGGAGGGSGAEDAHHKQTKDYNYNTATTKIDPSDPKSGERRMTAVEFYKDRWKTGKDIGAKYGKKPDSGKTGSNEGQKASGDNSQLPSSLTGGQRDS